MKGKLQEAASTLAQYDEKLIDLHGQGVLDGFTFEFLSFILLGYLKPVFHKHESQPILM